MQAGGHRVLASVLGLLILAALACNAPFAPGNATATPSLTPTIPGGSTPLVTPTNAPAPQVTIESPPNGSQAWVGETLVVRVRATDSIGVTRVEMHESGRIVASQPLPDPTAELTVLLNYTPARVGKVSLEVIAYRQSTSSNTVTLDVEFVATQAEVKNLNPAEATSGVVVGTICNVRSNLSGLSLRAGPGTNYANLAYLQAGEDLGVIGRNASRTWYQVRRGDGTLGWLSAGYVTLRGDCSTAPITTPVP